MKAFESMRLKEYPVDRLIAMRLNELARLKRAKELGAPKLVENRMIADVQKIERLLVKKGIMKQEYRLLRRGVVSSE